MPNMQLLPYFMAHAPVEVPVWFEHKKPEVDYVRPNPEKDLPAPLQKLGEMYMRDDAGMDFTDFVEFDDAELAEKYRKEIEAFENAWNEYWEKKREWSRRNQMERYFQWRKFYAVRMMEKVMEGVTREELL